MTITRQTIRDDDGTELGETFEAGRVLVYRDRTGYVAVDVPPRLSLEEAASLEALLGKVLPGAVATGRA